MSSSAQRLTHTDGQAGRQAGRHAGTHTPRHCEGLTRERERAVTALNGVAM